MYAGAAPTRSTFPLAKAAAPDLELDLSRARGPQRGVYVLDRVRSLLDEFAGAWKSSQIEATDFIQPPGCGSDHYWGRLDRLEAHMRRWGLSCREGDSRLRASPLRQPCS